MQRNEFSGQNKHTAMRGCEILSSGKNWLWIVPSGRMYDLTDFRSIYGGKTEELHVLKLNISRKCYNCKLASAERKQHLLEKLG